MNQKLEERKKTNPVKQHSTIARPSSIILSALYFLLLNSVTIDNTGCNRMHLAFPQQGKKDFKSTFALTFKKVELQWMVPLPNGNIFMQTKI